MERLVGGNLRDLPSLDGHEMVSFNRKVYIFGGFRSNNVQECVNDIYRVDTDAQTFQLLKVKGDVPSPRLGMTMSVYRDQKLVIFGGGNESVKYKDMYEFDLDRCQWKLITADVKIKKGILGHSMVYHRESDQFIIFGGVHGDSEENKILFRLNIKGQVIEIEEEQKMMSILLKGNSTGPKLQLSTSKTFDSKSRPRDFKGRSKKFFLNSPIEVKYYEKEFIVKEDKEIQHYRREDKQSLHMKNLLQMLGVFSTQAGYTNILKDENTKEILEKRILGNEGGNELSRGDFVKESKRPLPREGHAMVLQNDRLVILGGMRHTLSLNDISFIRIDNLCLPESENNHDNDKTRLDPSKHILFPLD